MSPSTPAERWARWKAKPPEPDTSKRRSYEISDQRRRAQQASVRARRHNASSRRQHEREEERRQETILQAILRGQSIPPKPLTEEHQNYLDNHWRRYIESQRQSAISRSQSWWLSPTPDPIDPFTLPLFTNIGDWETVRQVLGTDPLWVRATAGYRQSNASFVKSVRIPKSWWMRGYLTLAIRVEYSRYIGDEDGDYLHYVQFYYLRPIDLFTHIEGTSVAFEAVPWESVLANASDRINDAVSTMSISQVVRSIRRKLRLKAAADRQLERRHRPRSTRQGKATTAQTVTLVEAPPVQTEGRREEVQSGRQDVAPA